MNIPKSVAIRSSYYHHAQNAGYKQILKFTQPKVVFGIDENSKDHLGTIYAKYLFLNEWKAAKFINKNDIQLLHILYGEEYYRFSARLVKVPIVVTYHQPPAILQQEITTGDYMGRIAAWAHQLNRNRFEKLAAAIVMTDAQKEVLSQAVSPEKIHVLPLGADLETLTALSNSIQVAKQVNQIITVGEWQRDWDFYFKFVAYCEVNYADWKFVLVNRKLNEIYKKEVAKLKNLTYFDEVDDLKLYTLYKASILQLLPFKSAAGNNSINESLALGCPVVTNVIGANYRHKDEIIMVCKDYTLEGFASSCKFFTSQSIEKLINISQLANNSVSDFDWKGISNKTLEIYNSVI